MGKPVTISNYKELVTLVAGIKPKTEDKDPNLQATFKDVSTPSDQIIPELTVSAKLGSGTMAHKLLSDGFKMVKRQLEFGQAAQVFNDDVDSFGGFLPTPAPSNDKHVTWLDNFIRTSLGGRREGMHVVWDLPEGRYRMDPATYQLEKVNG
jgi:hypothetical protein